MDAKLAAYLRATGDAERERLLDELILGEAAPLVRATIRSRLRFVLDAGGASSADDVCQDVLARLVEWLCALRACPSHDGVRDFRQYVVRVAINACYDRLRRKHPLRTRLKDNLRDLFDRHRDFALWRDERDVFLAGFAIWEGRELTLPATERARQLANDPAACAGDIGGDPHEMSLAQLSAAILRWVGGPLEIDALVNAVVELQDIREQAAVPIDEEALGRRAAAGGVKCETEIEARETLAELWKIVCELPEQQRNCYFYNFSDDHGDDLFSLLCAFEVADPQEMAARLGLSRERLMIIAREMPLDRETIAEMLGVPRRRVNKLIFSAREKVRDRLLLALGRSAGQIRGIRTARNPGRRKRAKDINDLQGPLDSRQGKERKDARDRKE